MVKFNEALTRNREMREQIDNLRRERLMFDTIYKKLDRELTEKKTQMAEIIQQCIRVSVCEFYHIS
jgi:F0F1-type ATP synthase membrane subunit b/b'